MKKILLLGDSIRKGYDTYVEKAFKDVQDITHCSTGCGGCYEKVLDVISELMA